MVGGAAALAIVAAAGWFSLDPPRGAVRAEAVTAVPLGGAGAGEEGRGRPLSNDTTRTRGVAAIPGLGPGVRARIPARSRQVLVVAGRGRDSPESTATLWIRGADGRWRHLAPWRAHNAAHGWTLHHRLGDLRSPVGVFTLSDAGGLEPDPGSRLPYHRDRRFTVGGTGFEGEPLAGSFDYVLAIDYNRVRGTSPLNGAQPLGHERGGGIWIHVDHGGPTHACVSISEPHMVQLLRAVDPADRPVVVMGDRAWLAR